MLPAPLLHLRRLAKPQAPPPLCDLLKLRPRSQRKTRQSRQTLHPRRRCRHPRMVPAAKTMSPHPCPPLPPPPLHHLLLLLRPRLLCLLVQAHSFPRRQLQQKQVFSLRHSPLHYRPNLLLRFPHAALSARRHFTRRRLCPRCLYRRCCWETLRIVQRRPPLLRGHPGRRRNSAPDRHSLTFLYRPRCSEGTPPPRSCRSARLLCHPNQLLKRDQRFAVHGTVNANTPKVTGVNAV